MTLVYHVFAISALMLHGLFILWVVFGVLLTRGRPVLRTLHILSLIYSIAIDALPWPPCPLTVLENWLEARAGITPYQGSFLVHYLDALVYPSVPLGWLIAGAVVVCGFNLAVYVRRYRRRKAGHW